jgi:hypothetical protein
VTWPHNAACRTAFRSKTRRAMQRKPTADDLISKNYLIAVVANDKQLHAGAL